MLRKVIIFLLMLLYIYVQTFDIFLNQYFKFPVISVAVLLALFFREPKSKSFHFTWEMWLLFLANFFYYALAQGLLKPFIVNLLVFACCALFFNFFVGYSMKRLTTAVIMFFACLGLSVLIMCANHIEPVVLKMVRAALVGSPIVQSPSGVSTTIFTFGYQVIAFSTFIFLYAVLSKKHFLIVFLVLMVSLIGIFYGMQRSALIVFCISIALAIVCYYRLKAIPILILLGVCFFAFFEIASIYNTDKQYNILNKAAQSAELGEDRGGLITENLKIYSDYPLGLMFYDRKWSEVSRYNPTYQGGLTSHNAYLMFITYLGPIVGLVLLVILYYRLGLSFKTAIININRKNYALLASLCFTFLAISMNSLFHNAWLVNANGPTVFLFFCILQLNKIMFENGTHDHSEAKVIALSK